MHIAFIILAYACFSGQLVCIMDQMRNFKWLSSFILEPVRFFSPARDIGKGTVGILDYIAVVTGSFTARLIDLAILLGGCLD